MSKKEDEALPGVDSVLDKLKSDGTFDQFRRTCLSHIQGEPSFRAYTEHLEVVSRRYLQNYKWKDSSTKNEVRGRLRDHALGVIVSPDIHVGTPLIDIVEKVLESKAKELLPKITEAVDSLCDTRARQLKEAQAAKETASVPILSPGPTTDTANSDFDLSLLIDIPGLNTGTKSQPSKPPGGGGGGKREGQAKPKPKGTADTPKDLKTGNKNKTAPGGKAGLPSSGKAKSEGLQKQLHEKEVATKEKEKPRYRIPKKSKETATVDKQDKDPPPDASKTEESTTSSAKDRKSPSDELQGNTNSSAKVKKLSEEQSHKNTSVTSKDKNSSDEPKPLRRRSARIASQTDSKASSDNEGEGEPDCEEVHSKKRAKHSSGSSKKRSRLSNSEELWSEEEGSSGGCESDSDQPSEGESVQEMGEPKKKMNKKSDRREVSGRSLKQATYRSRISKSPSVVITRYNRSVKPNRRYFDDSAEIEEDVQSMSEEAAGTGAGQEETRRLSLNTHRSYDSGEMEVKGDAVVTEGEEPVYEMLTPKPPPLKIRKAVVKGLRSRKKTSTRVNFFCHR